MTPAEAAAEADRAIKLPDFASREDALRWAREDGRTLGDLCALERAYDYGIDCLDASPEFTAEQRDSIRAHFRPDPASIARARRPGFSPRFSGPTARRTCSGGRRRPGVRRVTSRSSASSGDPDSSEPPLGRLPLLAGRDRLLVGSLSRIGAVLS